MVGDQQEGCAIYDELASAPQADVHSEYGHRRELLASYRDPSKTSATNASNASFVDTQKGGAHAIHASAQEVGFLTLAIFLGVLARTWIVPKLCCGFMPYTVALIVIGTGIGGLQIITQWDDSRAILSPWCHLPTGFSKPGAFGGCNASQVCNEVTGELCQCSCKSWFDQLNVNTLANISPHVILYSELLMFLRSMHAH